MDDKNERLKKFEDALGPPEIAKFMPKVNTYPTIASLVEQLRAHIKGVDELCEQIDVAISASEEGARKVADAVIEMSKRIK
jgi:hypothetical protein